MIRITPLPAEIVVKRGPPPPPPPPEITARIDRIWTDERERRGPSLRNGRLLSIRQTDDAGFEVWETQYKWWIAQRQAPDLFPEIGIRPLAVTAFTHLLDAVVFARRSSEVTQDAGMWEIPPSGSVDPRRFPNGNKIDIAGQLLSELSAELNIAPSLVLAIQPFAVMEDTVENVVDIVFDLRLAPDRAEVERLFHIRAGREYTELDIWPFCDLHENLERRRGQMSPGAVAILRQRGMLPSDMVPA